MDINDLQYVKSGQLSEDEMNSLDGTRVNIARAEVVSTTSRYKDNELLPNEQEIEIMAIELETEPFGEALIGRNITHKQKYNLKEKDGQWTVSLHEKSNTGKFLAKYNLESFADVVGKSVVLTKKTNPDTKRSRILISI